MIDATKTKRRKTVLTAQDVADYFLTIVDRDNGDTLTNLKIQKLLYYAQGFSLALNRRPLFDEKIIRWELGPVVLEVYESLKKYGSDAIPKPEDFDISKFETDDLALLNEVFEVYGQFSAAALVDMTHAEPPWKSTKTRKEIDLKKMQNHFLTRLRHYDDD